MKNYWREPSQPRDSPFPSRIEILPEYREFERTSTTVVNAYLVPVMSGYLSEIERIAEARSRTAPARSKRQRAGEQFHGFASCSRTAAFSRPTLPPANRFERFCLAPREASSARNTSPKLPDSTASSLDMGGTSTDVALMDSGSGETLATTSESVVSGVPVAVPMLDIHTVGAGGGSIARFDRAGALARRPRKRRSRSRTDLLRARREGDGDGRESHPGTHPGIRPARRRV